MAILYLLILFILPIALITFFVITKRRNSPIAYTNQTILDEPEYVSFWVSHCQKKGINLNPTVRGPLTAWQIWNLPKGLTPVVRTRKRTPKQRYKNWNNLG